MNSTSETLEYTRTSWIRTTMPGTQMLNHTYQYVLYAKRNYGDEEESRGQKNLLCEKSYPKIYFLIKNIALTFFVYVLK